MARPSRRKPGAPDKSRLDALVEARGLADSRTQAQALIRAGRIWSGDKRLDKPGHSVRSDLDLELRGAERLWASRGGFKLDHALCHFDIDATGAAALDVGASTGGFTDVLLAHGAARVYAVDVGRGQLLWRLSQDPRVVVLDRLNARYIGPAHVPEPVDIVTCDASFIGLETVLPAPLSLTGPGARLVALIKPQFEVGRDEVGKGGIVRNATARAGACERVSAWLARQNGWRVLGIVESPIEGAGGNREYLIAGERG